MKTSVLNDKWWKNTASDNRVTLKLNTPVANISTHHDSHVEVVDESGGTHDAKYVIVTVSIGVLKESIKDGEKEGITFSPELPNETVSVKFACILENWICNF